MLCESVNYYATFANAPPCLGDVSFDFIYENNSASRTAPKEVTPDKARRNERQSERCIEKSHPPLPNCRFEKEKTEACAVSVNPGLVKTEIFRNEQSWFRALCKNITFPKTPLQGAQTILYVCLVDRWELAKGCYYSDCKVDHVRAYATDTKRAEVIKRTQCSSHPDHVGMCRMRTMEPFRKNFGKPSKDVTTELAMLTGDPL
ncbi:putative oxidoreductase, short-chain dehydrogenase family, putative [Plasmodium ovale curtisi]|uniref:Putative oxidoreductase, short-chain dehydrogenase family, putative n=1 Tax=Plasmodium ovale curtisi TaxID=864141 RepID=A0A1A8WS31_PLAOA|nr:putative oxidoreductase, short-chain dehydrogenase family, putative [Plasmodium ovale curtisi]